MKTPIEQAQDVVLSGRELSTLQITALMREFDADFSLDKGRHVVIKKCALFRALAAMARPNVTKLPMMGRIK